MFNPDFYKGKKIFLTGHTGLKGSYLSLMLQSMGSKVTGYALAPNTQPSLFELAKVSDGMQSIIADIRDAERVKEELAACRPDIVIHMAAQPLVRES